MANGNAARLNLCGNIPQKPLRRNQIEFCRHPSTQRQ
jgi:hypothetical protein